MFLTRRQAVAATAALAAARYGWAAPRPAPPTAIPLSAIRIAADGLRLPEGIAVDRGGRAFVSNQKAACLVIEPDGAQRFVGPATTANGLALDGRGGAIIALFGLLHDGPGPLVRLDLDSGAVTALAARIGERTLVASNFPAVSADGGIYCSHSTWADPANIGTTVRGGFVYRVAPDGGTAVVVDGIRGANGLAFDAGERHLYIAETASGRILRCARTARGFGPPEPVGPVLGAVLPDERADAVRARAAANRHDAGYPDGLAFDVEGNLWVTLPFANRIVAITPAGAVMTMIDDPGARLLDMPTNLAFGGPDLRDLWIVARAGGRVLRTRSPVAGLPMPHHR